MKFKNFLKGCVLILFANVVSGNVESENLLLTNERMEETDYDDLPMRDLQNDYRSTFLAILQFFGSINATVRTLQVRIESLSEEIRVMKEETTSFRSRMEDEIHNLKDQKQNVTSSITVEMGTGMDVHGDNTTEDRNQPQNFSSTNEPQMEEEGLDQRWLNDVLKNPVAKLYSGENFTGQTEWYSFENSSTGQVHELQRLRNRVKSVETFGKCIRLFHTSLALLSSLAVYPGSGNAHSVLNSKPLNVTHVGPCLRDEFQSSTFQDSKKETVRKNPNGKNYVPDYVEFFSLKSEHKIMVSLNPSSPILMTTLGPKNRVQALLAESFPRHINNPQPTNDMSKSSFFQSLDKQAGDVLGYGIPTRLGGPSDVPFNIFPQTSAGSSEWMGIALEVRQCLETDGNTKVLIGLNFIYADDDTTRPHAFYYLWWCFGRFPNISYGRVAN